MAGGAAIAAVGVYLLEVPFDLLLILLVVFLLDGCYKVDGQVQGGRKAI